MQMFALKKKKKTEKNGRVNPQQEKNKIKKIKDSYLLE